MIITPAKHYFEAKLPALEEGEEDQWYTHPEFPIQCNKLGILVFDDSMEVVYIADKSSWRYYEIRDGKRFVGNLGSSVKLAYECWSGTLAKWSKFTYKDGNPMNLTQDNIVVSHQLTAYEQKKVRDKHMEFIKNSLVYLCKRKERLEKRGVDFQLYYEFLQVPTWLHRYWKKYQCKSLEEVREIQTTQYQTSKATSEKLLKVKHFWELGWSQKRIAKELGWKNPSLVAYYIKKIVDANDI